MFLKSRKNSQDISLAADTFYKRTYIKYYSFTDFPTLSEQSSNFWDITPSSPLKVNQCFGGTCHLHLQGQRIINGLHSVTSQKTELFISTAVRTSVLSQTTLQATVSSSSFTN
jgi:hypothetical protein